MYHASAQGVDEHMIIVHYYYCVTKRKTIPGRKIYTTQTSKRLQGTLTLTETLLVLGLNKIVFIQHNHSPLFKQNCIHTA